MNIGPRNLLAAFLATVLVFCGVVAAESKDCIRAWDLAGMSLESVKDVNDMTEVITTGGKFKFDKQNGQIEFTQRIPNERKFATISVGLNLDGLIISRKGTGTVVLTGKDKSFSIEVSGDSVLIIRSEKPYTLKADIVFEPTSTQSNLDCRVYHDTGGFGIIPQPAGEMKPTETNKSYQVEVASNVRIYAFVFPPKHFPWEKSFEDRVVHNCSFRHPYPTEEEMKSYLPYGNILTLHSWVWQGKFGADYTKEYDNSWDPVTAVAKDDNLFKQTVDNAHKLGMKVVVYISPYYLADGDKDKDDNVDYFLSQQKSVIEKFNLDGVYYDGLYINGADCTERSYELVKRSREMLGEKGILYFHETASPLNIVTPFIDAYADYIVRGEHGSWSPFISGYNVSNSIGLYWYDDGRITEELIQKTLNSNARLHVLVGDGTWRGRNLFLASQELKLYEESYVPKLARMKEISYETYLKQSTK